MSRNNIWSATAKYPENLFSILKPGQKEKSYIFQEIGILKIYVQLSEKFQNLNNTSSLMPCLHNKIWVVWNGTVLGQNNLISSGGNI